MSFDPEAAFDPEATILVGGLQYPGPIAVDDDWVYWAKWGDDDGAILKVRKSGGDAISVAPARLNTNTDALVVDGATVYFMSIYGIMTAPTGGGEPALLYGDSNMKDIAVRGEDVYWLDSFHKAVLRGTKRGGMATTLAPAGLHVRKIALTASEIVWSESGTVDSVHAVSLEGGAPRLIGSPPGGIRDLAVDDGVYLGDNRGVWRTPLEGGDPILVAEPGAWGGMALDGDLVYWTTTAGGSGRLLKVPKAAAGATGELVRPFVASEVWRGLALHGRFAYLMARLDAQDPASWAIVRLGRDGQTTP